MKYVASFGGGLGDSFLRLYGHKLYNSLNQFKKLGEVDAVACCHSPVVKDVLESLDIFSNIFYYQWESNYNPLDEYLSTRPDTVDLHATDVGKFSQMPLTSFHDNKMHSHHYNISDVETGVLNKMKDLKYIVVHPSGGTQSVDGLSRKQYTLLIENILNNMSNMHVVVIGSNHQRSNHDKYVESSIELDHPRFIDLTNKTSGALCSNVVKCADAFIGTHSAWINMFWYFKKPTICILADYTAEFCGWGDRIGYQLNNGCNWGFFASWCKTITVGKDVNVDEISNLATGHLNGLMDSKMNKWIGWNTRYNDEIRIRK